MSWNVHIHVCFKCSENEPVAKIAMRHMESPGLPDEAQWFLQELSERTGRNIGPRGGLSMWGMVGNHTDGYEFVTSLRPFWSELLAAALDGGPCEAARIMVFTEAEQAGHAIAYEIYLNDYLEELEIDQHDCPFAWMQF